MVGRCGRVSRLAWSRRAVQLLVAAQAESLCYVSMLARARLRDGAGATSGKEQSRSIPRAAVAGPRQSGVEPPHSKLKPWVSRG